MFDVQNFDSYFRKFKKEITRITKVMESAVLEFNPNYTPFDWNYASHWHVGDSATTLYAITSGMNGTESRTIVINNSFFNLDEGSIKVLVKTSLENGTLKIFV